MKQRKQAKAKGLASERRGKRLGAIEIRDDAGLRHAGTFPEREAKQLARRYNRDAEMAGKSWRARVIAIL